MGTYEEKVSEDQYVESEASNDIEISQKDVEVVAYDWDIASEVVQSSLVKDEEKCDESTVTFSAAFMTEVLSSNEEDEKIEEEPIEIPKDVTLDDLTEISP